MHYSKTEITTHFESTPQAELDNRCAMCNTPTTSLCSVCKGVHYCSQICQKSDWSLHKLCCQSYDLFATSANMVRSILFGGTSDRPFPMIAPLQVDASTGRLEVTGWPNLLGIEQDYVNLTRDNVEALRITRNPLRRRDLRGSGRAIEELEIYAGHSLVLYMRKDRDELPVNKALEACAKSCGFELLSPLRGPLLVLREEISDGLFRNCTLQDFRDVIDYLRLHGTEDGEGLSYAKLGRAPVMGALINCWDEASGEGSVPVAPRLIPECHPLLNGAGDVSSISKLLGLPVTMMRAPDSVLSMGKNMRNDRSDDIVSSAEGGGPPNASEPAASGELEDARRRPAYREGARFLQVSSRIKSKAWGQIPSNWQRKLGDVLAVRNDGEDIDPQVLFCMLRYAKHTVPCLFKCVIKKEKVIGEDRVARQAVLNQMKWENMMRFKLVLPHDNATFDQEDAAG